MCAAPGIKTSLMAQFMNNKGHIIAGEFHTERANMMRISLMRGISIMRPYFNFMQRS